MQRRNRITGSDGSSAATGPPRHLRVPPRSAGKRIARTSRALFELARSPELQHVPTRGQVQLMARFDGRRPSTYRLERGVDPLFDLATDFPFGSNGLRFAHADGEMVVLPNGWGCSL